MKTKYKYIRFEVKEDEKNVWWCKNDRFGYKLGQINWHNPWDTYCFSPLDVMGFSPDCLRDIADFLEQLNKERQK